MTSKKYDETRSDPASHKQWHERSGMPIAVRPMSAEEVKDFRVALAKSYGVSVDCIGCEVSKIEDPEDPDRNDCVIIHFTVKFVDGGVVRVRRINKFKVPVPEKIKEQARQVQTAPVPQDIRPPYMRADSSVLYVPPPRSSSARQTPTGGVPTSGAASPIRMQTGDADSAGQSLPPLEKFVPVGRPIIPRKTPK